MERILTQEEIAELLTVVEREEPMPPNRPLPPAESRVERLDLFRLNSTTRQEQANLDRLLMKFADRLADTLSNHLRQLVRIEPGDCMKVELRQLPRHVPAGSALGHFATGESGTTLLMVFDPQLVDLGIGFLLGGGSGLAERSGRRRLTLLETALLEDLFREAGADFSACFNLETGDHLLLRRVSDQTGMSASGDNLLVTLLFDLDVRLDGCRSVIKLVLPVSLAGKLANQASPIREARSEKSTWAARWQHHLAAIPLAIAVEMPTISLNMRDFLDLKTGDVIDVPLGSQNRLTLSVGGRPTCRGTATEHNGHRSFQCSRRPDERNQP